MPCLVVTAQQETTITEIEFYQQLQQTRSDLQTALTNPGTTRESILRTNTDRWLNISAVQTDDAIIPIDTGWLQLATNADGETIQTALERIEALENYTGKQGISLDGLGDLTEQEPDPPPQRAPELRSPVNPAVQGFSRVLLIAFGIIGVIALLFAVARGLTFKTAVTPIKLTEDEDPQTSDDALDRAKSSEKVQDYRAAVRYLYISSLLMLDESGLIRYDPTLTNQEHLVQIDNRPNLKAILTPIINFFDRTWYGFAPISDEDYEHFRQQVNQLHKLTSERPQ